MNLKEELKKFRIWQKENKSRIYLYTPDFMVETYLADTEQALNIDDVSKRFCYHCEEPVKVNNAGTWIICCECGYQEEVK